jgi:imidazole glycerol-phosphate synthase subunit HisH
MITIVDFFSGNPGSLLNMFKKIGVAAEIAADPALLIKAKKIVLPGVGAFDSAMRHLNSGSDLREILDHKVLDERIPVLGICLGMQLMGSSSEEGRLAGLGWIPGESKLLPIKNGLKVPHMGWNRVLPAKSCVLANGIDSESKYYFVHSYYFTAQNESHSLMKTHYGIEFDSAIGRDNIYGVQFHPEKSHRYGMQVLNNFAEL